MPAAVSAAVPRAALRGAATRWPWFGPRCAARTRAGAPPVESVFVFDSVCWDRHKSFTPPRLSGKPVKNTWYEAGASSRKHPDTDRSPIVLRENIYI